MQCLPCASSLVMPFRLLSPPFTLCHPSSPPPVPLLSPAGLLHHSVGSGHPAAVPPGHLVGGLPGGGMPVGCTQTYISEMCTNQKNNHLAFTFPSPTLSSSHTIPSCMSRRRLRSNSTPVPHPTGGILLAAALLHHTELRQLHVGLVKTISLATSGVCGWQSGGCRMGLKRGGEGRGREGGDLRVSHLPQ